MRKVEIFMGAMLIIIGFALITGSFSSISFWLLETFPSLAIVG